MPTIGLFTTATGLNERLTDDAGSFETYAQHRIEGAVIDGLRRYTEFNRTDRATLQLVSYDAMSDGYDEDQWTFFEDTSARTEFDIVDLDERRRLGAAINRLPNGDRLVVILYFFEGLHLHQIADLFGVTDSRICQRVAEITSKLREKLTHDG